MQDPTSLDRLHDIVLPPAVPWWPPAPGWYGVLAIAVIATGWLARRAWKRWRADAYRRAALRELGQLREAAKIAELLRRTALQCAPRSAVAARSGRDWTDWLAARCSVPMPPAVQDLLCGGIYRAGVAERQVGDLRDYTGHWIQRHERLPQASEEAA